MARDEINAFLGSGTVYQGKLNFQGSVRIDGVFNGEVHSEGTLIIGKDARVEGQVRVGQLVLSGHIQGEIIATKKAVLHRTANLVGSLHSPVLMVEEGAKLEGRIAMQTVPSASGDDDSDQETK
ncbi:polymer-forming cytoskeletal protein [Desulfovibrio subterraneus]|jgi:cytoskeletal protein CcmA (bactofilin family)|uniref:Membrane protein n=1 Tax=Desulfovibrio subterraneus TaxID=2718620 RepID=A0A7J0BFL2_9BACT|nr:polymer-forming cytoskeletal protein [Desulfovibrio subterraneus]WBF68791.1 polymer-forming cytoskeletal protein [Desulfovibrio subterraneus]GFM31982.1 membrane protein [Desulfovibrio subterraneus]